MKQRYTNDQIRTVIDDTLKREGLWYNNNISGSGSTTNNATLKSTIHMDEASHYILRISYCQTEELRRWFLQMECELLRHRLLVQNVDLTKSVKSIMNLRPIASQQKQELQEPLQQLYRNTMSNQNDKKMPSFHDTKFYSVPFLEALDLLSKRECYLHQGMAYMTQHKLVTILLQKFRTSLSQSLLYMCQHHPITSSTTPPKHASAATTSAAESLRLEPFLRNINQCLTNPASDATDANEMAAGSGITAGTFLQHRNSMPLCMRQLQTGLEQDHKLKHWGRLQYGLFLKGTGMSMEDTLLFLSRHFTAVTNEKFQKEYAYNIRHMYGKEGKRASYTPYNCTKIILGNAPGSGEHHGCPYKHYDVDHLEMLLHKDLKITNAADRQDIMKLKVSHQYQLACVKQFEIQHRKFQNSTAVVDTSMLDNVGNHPNSWFRASVYYHGQQQQQQDDKQHATTPHHHTKANLHYSSTKTISP